MRERKLTDPEIAYLGPVAMAQFVEAGWIREWPLTVSRGGEKAARQGFGRDHLPWATEPGSLGAYWWEGRRP